MQESEIVATTSSSDGRHSSIWCRGTTALSDGTENPSYVQLLNSEIIGKSLNKIDGICERIEGRWRRLASEAKAKYKIVKGAVAYQRLGYTKQLAVCELTRVCFVLTAVPNCGLNVANFWPWNYWIWHTFPFFQNPNFFYLQKLWFYVPKRLTP